jgi:hypothetical protein
VVKKELIHQVQQSRMFDNAFIEIQDNRGTCWKVKSAIKRKQSESKSENTNL